MESYNLIKNILITNSNGNQIKLNILYDKSYNINYKDFHKSENTLCSICYDIYNNEKIILTKCNHYFHIICIKKWLKQNITCPICRNNILNNF